MLISAVLQELIDEAVLDLTTTGMLVYMKSGLRQLATVLKYRGFMTEGTLSVATSAQTASLASLSAGFVREISVWYVSNGLRVTIEKPQSIPYYNSIRTTNVGGKPQFYKIEGTTMDFDRPADEPLTVGIDYFKEISAVALTDTFLGDERVIQAAKHLCLGQYYKLYEEDLDAAKDERFMAYSILGIVGEDYETENQGGNVECKESDGF